MTFTTSPTPAGALTATAGVLPLRGRPRQSRRRRWFASHPAWPVTALLAGYPIWWALGLADESVIILAIPMLLRMRSWHRSGRSIKAPPAFGLWLLFLVCAAAGIATLGLSAPDTVVSALSNRILSFTDRGLTYLGLTVILLYAGNLTEAELPRRWAAWSRPVSSSPPRWPTCCRTAFRTTAWSKRPSIRVSRRSLTFSG